MLGSRVGLKLNHSKSNQKSETTKIKFANENPCLAAAVSCLSVLEVSTHETSGAYFEERFCRFIKLRRHKYRQLLTVSPPCSWSFWFLSWWGWKILFKLRVTSWFVQQITNVYAYEDSGCEAVRKVFRPRECCSFPLPYMPLKAVNECDEKCQKTSTSEFIACCTHECLEDNFPFYIDGKINSTNILATFDEDMGNRNISLTEWQPTLDQSIAACEKLGQRKPKSNCSKLTKSSFTGPLINEIKCGNKTIKNSMGIVAVCMVNMNFFNCPATSYTATEECETMKKTARSIDKCVFKHGDTSFLELLLFYSNEWN